MPTSKLYGDFTQAELDHQYSPSQWVPNTSPSIAIHRHILRLSKCPEHLLANAHYSRYSYSDYPSCNVHLIQPKEDKSNHILIYLHGGYWTAGVLENCGLWLWEGVKHTDATLAAVEYGLSPPCKMEQIVLHVRTAVAFISKTFPRYDLHIVGHSAGGHLAAMCVGVNWTPKVAISSTTCISGVFDLEPVRLSCVNWESQLGLQVEDCEKFSPILMIENIGLCLPKEVVVVVGAFDSPEFQRQSREFFEAVQRKISAQGSSCKATYLRLEEDHFSVVEKLDMPHYQLTKLIARLLQPGEE